MAEAVCDKKECSLYGYYHNMEKFPKLVKIKRKIQDESCGGWGEDHYKDSSMIENLRMKYTTLHSEFLIKCTNCSNFSKPDMSTYWTKEEAKKLLLEK